MEISVNDQLRQIIAAMVSGGLVGLLLDISEAMICREKYGRKRPRIMTAVLSFGIVTAVGRASGSGMRLFFLLAAAGGVCLYLWAVHPMMSGDLISIKHYLQYYAQSAHKNAFAMLKKSQRRIKTKEKDCNYKKSV